MLRSLEELHGYTIHATDGDIGTVYAFFFDDKTWAIRYLVVDTGAWLPGRRVLISPSLWDSLTGLVSFSPSNLRPSKYGTVLILIRTSRYLASKRVSYIPITNGPPTGRGAIP